MDMVVLGSAEEEGCDVAEKTGEGCGVVGSAEGTAGAGALVSVGVSMGCGSSSCSTPAGATGSAL